MNMGQYRKTHNIEVEEEDYSKIYHGELRFIVIPSITSSLTVITGEEESKEEEFIENDLLIINKVDLPKKENNPLNATCYEKNDLICERLPENMLGRVTTTQHLYIDGIEKFIIVGFKICDLVDRD